jgi:hypothetical protein
VLTMALNCSVARRLPVKRPAVPCASVSLSNDLGLGPLARATCNALGKYGVCADVEMSAWLPV